MLCSESLCRKRGDLQGRLSRRSMLMMARTLETLLIREATYGRLIMHSIHSSHTL
jgi:hypothetical protein